MRWKLARWKIVILKNLKSYRLSRAFRLYIIVLPVIQFQLNNAESRWNDCCSLMKNKCRWSEFAGDNVPWFCFRSEFVFFFLLVSFACLADPWLMILIFWKNQSKNINISEIYLSLPQYRRLLKEKMSCLERNTIEIILITKYTIIFITILEVVINSNLVLMKLWLLFHR